MEGCGYRDLYAEFQALGVDIVGVSFDAPATNRAWSEAEGFQFELWSDDPHTLAVAYGAAADVTATEAAGLVLLDADTVLTLIFRGGTHPDDVLADCRLLFGP